MHKPRKLGLYFEDLGLYIFLYNTKPVSIRAYYLTVLQILLIFGKGGTIRYGMKMADAKNEKHGLNNWHTEAFQTYVIIRV